MYIFGGNDGNLEDAKIQEFNTLTEEVRIVGYLPTPLLEPSGVWYEDSIFIFGGYRWGGAGVPQVLKFTPSTGSMELVQQLSRGVSWAHPVVKGSTAYIVGGSLWSPYSVPDYHYTEFNLRTYEYQNQNFTSLPSDFVLGLYTSAAYVRQTEEIVIIGGNNATTYQEVPDIYRIKL
jgi:hypothetical protein